MLHYPTTNILDHFPNTIQKSGYCKLSIFISNLVPPINHLFPGIFYQSPQKCSSGSKSSANGGKTRFCNACPINVCKESSNLYSYLLPVDACKRFCNGIKKSNHQITGCLCKLDHIEPQQETGQRLNGYLESGP